MINYSGIELIRNIWSLIARKVHSWCVMSHAREKRGVIIVEIIIIGTISTFEQQGGSREVNLKRDLHVESSIRISIEASYSFGGKLD